MVHLGGQLGAFGAIMASLKSTWSPRGAQFLILTVPRDPKMDPQMGLFFDMFLRCL